jgi:hypothetical protein
MKAARGRGWKPSLFKTEEQANFFSDLSGDSKNVHS